MGRILALVSCLFLISCGGPTNQFSACRSSDLILLPHHMIVEKYIREMYSALDEPRSVVIVSPDHFSTGEFTISTPSENEHGFTIHRDLVSEFF